MQFGLPSPPEPTCSVSLTLPDGRMSSTDVPLATLADYFAGLGSEVQTYLTELRLLMPKPIVLTISLAGDAELNSGPIPISTNPRWHGTPFLVPERSQSS